MDTFSEFLKKQIHNTKISIQALSKLSGVDRSHIQKMIKGERIPADKNILEKMISVMMLPHQQSERLRDLYQIARIGESVYNRHMIIKDFIESFSNFNGANISSITTDYNHNLSGISDADVAYGTGNINSIVKAIIETEAGKPNGNIKILAQPEYVFLTDLLTSIGQNKKDLSITHIMQLRSSMDEDEEYGYNLECIKSITPILVSGCLYNPMYYYDNYDYNNSIASILPIIIITDDFVINISYNIDFATIFHKPSLIEFYTAIFIKISSIAKPMITKINSPLEHLMHYVDMEAHSSPKFYSFFPQPCLALFFTPEIIKKYISSDIPEKEVISEAYIKRINNYNHLCYDNYCLISFFSEAGIKSFTDTGRLSEIPSEYYSPIDKKDCTQLLDSMHELSLQSMYKPYIIDNNKFKMPNNLVISAISESCVSLIYTHPAYGTMSFAVKEHSISHSVYHFMEFLENGNFMLSKERCQDIIDDSIMRLKTEI